MNIGLTEEERKRSISLLNGLLADHFTLMLKVWAFHWNVVGPSFESYHKDMQKLYEAQIERVDDTAERIRALNGRTLTSMSGMMSHNHILEFGEEQPVPEALKMWEIITNDWGVLIKSIRDIHKAVPENDLGTLNFLEDMIETMEKEDWFNRSRNATPGA